MAKRPLELTKEEHEVYTKAFMEADKDRNGWLSREEMGNWLRGAGYNLTEQQAENVFRMIDSNADGRISLDEFYTAMHLIKHPPNKTSELQRVFSAMDTNGDGQLSENELHEGLNKCGYNFSKQQIKKFVANLDKNGDGQIDFQEFMAAFNS